MGHWSPSGPRAPMRSHSRCKWKLMKTRSAVSHGCEGERRFEGRGFRIVRAEGEIRRIAGRSKSAGSG